MFFLHVLRVENPERCLLTDNLIFLADKDEGDSCGDYYDQKTGK